MVTSAAWETAYTVESAQYLGQVTGISLSPKKQDAALSWGS